jgi:hypothetical protein
LRDRSIALSPMPMNAGTNMHLKSIVELGMIEYWHDGMISPGQKWRDEITVSIEKAQIAVLLVSADFLASDFISASFEK